MTSIFTPLVDFFRKHFRAFEALGLLLVLGSWSFNWWSTEDWSDASTSLRDRYDLVERAVMIVQTMNVIRFEAAVSREAVNNSPRPFASYREMLDAAWKSGEVRQQKVAMVGLKATGLEIFLSDISPLISSYADMHYPTLVHVQAQLGALRTELHRIMPAEKDTPLTQAVVPSAQLFTLEAAEQLDVSVTEVVTATMQLKQKVQEHIQEQKRRRTLVASGVFLIGSIIVALAKLLEWTANLKREAISAPASRRDATVDRKVTKGR